MPCGETARYSVFYDSLIHLQRPPLVDVVMARSANVAENRNLITDRALEVGAEWIFYVDDDQVLPSFTLTNLLKHDKDVVSGLYVKRQAPYIPHVYNEEDEKGFCSPKMLTPLSGGLVKVLATGAGCMLVKTKIFEKLEKPYWRLGQIEPEGWGDDLHFCHRVRELGFEIWADLDTRVGHISHGILWPKKEQSGDWSTVLVEGPNIVASWPAAQEATKLLKVM